MGIFATLLWEGMMTQDHVDRFVQDLVKKGIDVTTTDKALLSCFLQWYYLDLVLTQKERNANG